MTSVLTRWLAPDDDEAADRDSRTRGRARPAILLTGAIAGAGAAVAGLLILGALVGLAWIVEPAVAGSVVGPARFSAQAWLLGHGADVATGGVVVAVTPLGLTALLVVCCWYASCWAGRRAQVDSLAEIGTVLAALVLTYTAVGISLTALGSTAGADISWDSVLPGLVGLSAVVGAAGLLRTAGHGRLIHDIAPFPSRAVLAGVGGGAAAIVAAGVFVVGIAIAVDRAGFAALTESVAPSWTAGIGMFLLSMLMLPNAALYAVAVLLGPGFAVGAGTTVSAFGVTLGLVPALPILAALPDEPAVPLGALLGLTIPALCGCAVGAVVLRRLDEDERPLPAACWAAAAGLVLAIGLGFAQWLAGGSLGAVGLATIGAPALTTAFAAAALLCVPAALVSALLARRQLRRR